MNYSNARPNAAQYQAQQILNATPAQQVVMMYDGALKFCQKAKEAIENGDIQGRHNANKRAMEIISYMLDILDLEKGGDVARRLQVIYSFLIRRLMEVDFRNDPRICDEVMVHLRTLRASWDRIGQTGSSGTESSSEAAAGPIRSAVA